MHSFSLLSLIRSSFSFSVDLGFCLARVRLSQGFLTFNSFVSFLVSFQKVVLLFIGFFRVLIATRDLGLRQICPNSVAPIESANVSRLGFFSPFVDSSFIHSLQIRVSSLC